MAILPSLDKFNLNKNANSERGSLGNSKYNQAIFVPQFTNQATLAKSGFTTITGMGTLDKSLMKVEMNQSWPVHFNHTESTLINTLTFVCC